MKVSVGFPGLLFIAFLVLKLTAVISWSWVWVFAPLWIPFGGALILAVIAGLLGLVAKRLETPGQRAARQVRGLAR